jgi:hypothetical protein
MNYSILIMVLMEMVSMEANGQLGRLPSYPYSLQIHIVYFVFFRRHVTRSHGGGGG